MKSSKPIGSQRHETQAMTLRGNIQTRVLNELRKLEKLEPLNPLEYIDSRNQFLSIFDWTESTLEPENKQAVEALFLNFLTFLHYLTSTMESIQSSECNPHF